MILFNMAKNIYWSILLALAVAGAVMIYCSFGYEWYKVSDNEIAELSRRLDNKPRDERSRKWYAEIKKLETPRKTLEDTGTGLIALAFILGLLRLSTGFPLRGSRTPKSRWLFIVMYLLVIAVQIPDSLWYFGHRQARFEYPMWGDSIIIGIVEAVMGCGLFAILGCIFWCPFLIMSRFPAPLFTWPSNQPVFNTIVTVCMGGLALIPIADIFYEGRDGSISGVWLSVVLIYLLLSLRAGIVSQRFENKKNKDADNLPDDVNGRTENMKPDFILLSKDDYVLEEPRSCFPIKKLKGRGGPYLLVKIDPPIIGQAYGLGEKDIEYVVLGVKFVGTSLFSISEWPLSVNVARPLCDIESKISLDVKKDLEIIAWANIYKDAENLPEWYKRQGSKI